MLPPTQYGQPPPGLPAYGQPPPSPPQPPYRSPPQQRGESALAIGALICGILSWTFGGIFAAIPGAILGWVEINRINRGESPPNGKVLAQIGLWASVAHIAITVLACGGVICFYFVIAAGLLGAGALR